MIGANDLLQDVASSLGPDERLGVGVVVGDVLADGRYQVRHTGEHPPAQPLDGDIAKEPLDHIQPGRRGGREVDVNAGCLVSHSCTTGCLCVA